MATKTAGTISTTAIPYALQWFPGGQTLADWATLNAAAKTDEYHVEGINNAYPRPAARSSIDVGSGIVTISGRGQLQLQPGDWVLVDGGGNVMVVTEDSMAATPTLSGTTNSTTTLTVATSAITAGWQIGMPLKDASGDIPAGTVIAAISSNGLTVTMSAAATGSHGSNNTTAGNWTHS